jgi:hypothetical protein
MCGTDWSKFNLNLLAEEHFGNDHVVTFYPIGNKKIVGGMGKVFLIHLRDSWKF